MKKITIFVAVIAGFIFYSWQQAQRIEHLKQECLRHEANAEVLLSEASRYRTEAGHSAAKANALALTVEELRAMRAADWATIKGLRLKMRELEEYSAAQTELVATLQGQARDTLIIEAENEADTIKSVHWDDGWVRLGGLIHRNGYFDFTLSVVDSLLLVETVQRRRFLGFLWRTKKIKSKAVDVVSKNPHTRIANIERITVEQR